MPSKDTKFRLSGEDVQVFRLSRRLSRDDLAEWLGVTKQMIWNYERVGMNHQQALALAAIDRGLKPWQPTQDDRDIAEEIKEV